MGDFVENESILKDAKNKLKIIEATLRLENNPDFRKVFTNFLFKDLVCELTLVLGVLNKTEGSTEHIIKQLNALGSIQVMLNTLKNEKESFTDTIANCEDYRKNNIINN